MLPCTTPFFAALGRRVHDCADAAIGPRNPTTPTLTCHRVGLGIRTRDEPAPGDGCSLRSGADFGGDMRARPGRFRSARRRLSHRSGAQRRSCSLRRALRSRQSLSRVELFLPADGVARRDVPAEKRGHGCEGRQLLRIRGSWSGADRAEDRTDRVFHRSHGRRLPLLRNRGRPDRRILRQGVPGRSPVSRLHLSPSGLWWRVCALLSEGQGHTAAPQTLLHFRGCTLGLPSKRGLACRNRL
jgi:hypothetical protein